MTLKALAQLMLTPLPSFLKVAAYRMMGARIGEGARIAPMSVLVADDIDLGPLARIKPLSIIMGLSRFRLGAYAGISNLCLLNGSAAFELGPRSFVGPGCMIDLDADVTIGEHSGISPRTTILTHGIFLPATWGFRRKIGPVTIGDMVWITNNCKIAAGVKIASGVVVLPNSVINADVDSACLLHDTSLKRSRFSLQLLQKRISRAWLDGFIAELADELCRSFFVPQGYHLRDEVNRRVVERGGARICIEMFDAGAPRSGSARSDEDGAEPWVFGYHLPDEIMCGSRNVQAMDFLNLLYSSNAGRQMKKAAKYFQHYWGLRFADYCHREHFKLQPPAFVDEGATSDAAAAQTQAAHATASGAQ